MARGILTGRSANLSAATVEAKRALKQAKNWDQTKAHMRVWLVGKYALSRTTVDDYLNVCRARLLMDPETKALMGEERL